MRIAPQTQPIASLNQLRVPSGALGDFFGPGTTVGIPFAALVRCASKLLVGAGTERRQSRPLRALRSRDTDPFGSRLDLLSLQARRQRSALPKYPRLPVLVCSGYEKLPAPLD